MKNNETSGASNVPTIWPLNLLCFGIERDQHSFSFIFASFFFLKERNFIHLGAAGGCMWLQTLVFCSRMDGKTFS